FVRVIGLPEYLSKEGRGQKLIAQARCGNLENWNKYWEEEEGRRCDLCGDRFGNLERLTRDCKETDRDIRMEDVSAQPELDEASRTMCIKSDLTPADNISSQPSILRERVSPGPPRLALWVSYLITNSRGPQLFSTGYRKPELLLPPSRLARHLRLSLCKVCLGTDLIYGSHVWINTNQQNLRRLQTSVQQEIYTTSWTPPRDRAMEKSSHAAERFQRMSPFVTLSVKPSKYTDVDCHRIHGEPREGGLASTRKYCALTLLQAKDRKGRAISLVVEAVELKQTTAGEYFYSSSKSSAEISNCLEHGGGTEVEEIQVGIVGASNLHAILFHARRRQLPDGEKSGSDEKIPPKRKSNGFVNAWTFVYEELARRSKSKNKTGDRALKKSVVGSANKFREQRGREREEKEGYLFGAVDKTARLGKTQLLPI
ncbi:hypothetical protein WH47_07275, partial [Habropoda laboriosa]